MFICQTCNKPSKPGEKQHKVTVATRHKKYPMRTYSVRNREPITDPGGEGEEILKEINVDANCALLHKHGEVR